MFAAPTMPDPAKPKNLSPYFSFCKHNREKVKAQLKESGQSTSASALTKALAQLWWSLGESEKQAYSRPTKEVEEGSVVAVEDPDDGPLHSSLGRDQGVEMDDGTGNGRDFVEASNIEHSEGVQTEDDNVPVFPISRIKRIVKLDKEFRQVSAEVAVLIMSATQLFLEHLSGAALSAALQKKHKSIRLEDVRSAVNTDRRVADFSGDALDDLFYTGKEAESGSDCEDNDQVDRVQAEAGNDNYLSKKTKVVKKTVPTPLPGSRRIMDFFGNKTDASENSGIAAESR